MHEIIPLFGRNSVGQSAIVSATDFALHGRYVWYATAPSPVFRFQQAYRPIRLANGKWTRLYLAREVVGLHRLDRDRLVTFHSRNHLDCRRQNIQVLYATRDSTPSRFAGVSYCEPIGQWRSEISAADGTYWFLGYSPSEQLAAKRYHLLLDILLQEYPEYADQIVAAPEGRRQR